MLDLRSMSDEDFTVFVTPSAPQATMRVTVEESGKVLLSSKVAEKFSKMPVRIQFNRDYTAIQISQAIDGEESIVFPKNGRKGGLNASELLRKTTYLCPLFFAAISAMSLINGGVSANKTLFQGPRQLSEPQGRNR